MFASTMDEFSTNAQNRLVDHDATESERQYAMWMHLSLLGAVVMPVVVFIVPLVMWLTRKDDSPYIDDHGREALNFQISLAIYAIALPILAVPIGLLLCGVGIVVTVPAAAFLPYVLGAIGMIGAAKSANRGEYYRYPMSIRFL